MTVFPPGITVAQVSDGIRPFSHVVGLLKSPLAIAVQIGLNVAVAVVVTAGAAVASKRR